MVYDNSIFDNELLQGEMAFLPAPRICSRGLPLRHRSG